MKRPFVLSGSPSYPVAALSSPLLSYDTFFFSFLILITIQMSDLLWKLPPHTHPASGLWGVVLCMSLVLPSPRLLVVSVSRSITFSPLPPCLIARLSLDVRACASLSHPLHQVSVYHWGVMTIGLEIHIGVGGGVSPLTCLASNSLWCPSGFP